MKRLGEGSTWAGIAAFLSSMIPMFPPAAPYLTAATAVSAAVAAALKDKGAQ